MTAVNVHTMLMILHSKNFYQQQEPWPWLEQLANHWRLPAAALLEVDCSRRRSEKLDLA